MATAFTFDNEAFESFIRCLFVLEDYVVRVEFEDLEYESGDYVIHRIDADVDRDWELNFLLARKWDQEKAVDKGHFVALPVSKILAIHIY